jgi:hypothetical protein
VEYIEANTYRPEEPLYVVAVRGIEGVKQWATRRPPRVIPSSALRLAMCGPIEDDDWPVLQPMDPSRSGNDHKQFCRGWNAYRNCQLKAMGEKGAPTCNAADSTSGR